MAISVAPHVHVAVTARWPIRISMSWWTGTGYRPARRVPTRFARESRGLIDKHPYKMVQARCGYPAQGCASGMSWPREVGGAGAMTRALCDALAAILQQDGREDVGATRLAAPATQARRQVSQTPTLPRSRQGTSQTTRRDHLRVGRITGQPDPDRFSARTPLLRGTRTRQREGED